MSEITAAMARRAFLDALMVGESGGRYNVLYGGGTFSDFSQFPQWAGVRLPNGQMTHAAGGPQFQPATYALCAAHLGLTDFSPASQDAAAWWLAETVYREKTSRELEADLVAQDTTQVAAALHATWTSLGTAFPGRYRRALAQLGAEVADDTPAPVPVPVASPRVAPAPFHTTIAATGLGGWLTVIGLHGLQAQGWAIADPDLQLSIYGVLSAAVAVVLHRWPWLGASAGSAPLPSGSPAK
jgi:muramidase (phage lysozyme)